MIRSEKTIGETKVKRIWVVDDDRSIRWVLEKALNRAQMPCRLFESAEEVLEALKDEVPAVLLRDIRIIFMTVWNALRQDENAY